MTVAVLLYGDYPKHARRVLTPLAPLSRAGLIDLRVGMNIVSDTTKQVVDEVLPHAGGEFEGYLLSCSPQIFKYPMMRRLFFDEAKPVTTSHVIWFDDDSWVTHPDPEHWLRDVVLASIGTEWLGQLWTISLSKHQREWVKTRPWYKGKPIPSPVSFPQGAWWVARLSALRSVDWPDPLIRHRGGDAMTGVMIDQQGYRFKNYSAGVAVNADDSGRPSKSERRGYDEDPAGMIGWVPFGKKSTDRGVIDATVYRGRSADRKD